MIIRLCFLSLATPDSSSSAPRMHSALTTPRASAVTAGPVSMETGVTVYLRVSALSRSNIILDIYFHVFSLDLVKCFVAASPGAPQRVSGKVRGTVTVGSTPVNLNDIDLHAYIVVGDGRAYTAISEVGSRNRVLDPEIKSLNFCRSRLCNLCADWSGTRASGLGSDAGCTNRRAVWMAVCP